jgi:hypothetical protein
MQETLQAAPIQIHKIAAQCKPKTQKNRRANAINLGDQGFNHTRLRSILLHANLKRSILVCCDSSFIPAFLQGTSFGLIFDSGREMRFPVVLKG